MSFFYLIVVALFLTSYVYGAEWSYDGGSSPKHWAELSKDYKVCGSGLRQSPINLVAKNALKGKQQLSIHYHPTAATILNNGHTVEFDLKQKNEISLDGIRYELLQFHWHADSEHTVDSKHFPAELHLVHKSSAGKLAVISLLVEVGESKAFDHIFDLIPNIGKKTSTTGNIELSKLIPKNKKHFYYVGSLTTPPCTEGVDWIVFNQHLKIPARQLKKFKSYYSHDFRNTQAQNNRKVYVVN